LEGVAKGTGLRPLFPSPQASWERWHLTGILPASAGTGWWERKAVSLDRRLGDACRLEGGAPGYGLLRHPLGGKGFGWIGSHPEPVACCGHL